jgi:hypothetical protein
MERLGVRVRTLFSLGIVNIVRVAFYRLKLKIAKKRTQVFCVDLPAGPFYKEASCVRKITPAQTWRETVRYFGWYPVSLTQKNPEWHVNPFTGCCVEKSNLPYWDIPDFDPEVGDIKTVWEASRFEWVLAMAQRVATGDESELTRLNAWLADWCLQNRAYCGPNWKCGQEASIRVMHLAISALLLGQIQKPEAGLIDLVVMHLARIDSTLSYAIAQDNNHGTSEAAALFIGGTWLDCVRPDKVSRRYCLRGRKWLENRTRRLIEIDGSFSQYSVNYHRVVLDTLSMVEIWRRELSLPCFSDTFYERCRVAMEWLSMFTQPETGDTPNIGANDGARLFPLSDTDYRDYRPSVQLAAALFSDAVAYAAQGSYDIPLEWLKIRKPTVVLAPATKFLFNRGGYVFLEEGEARVYFRFPRFRFRPSQADALHVDFWLAGKNVLRDGGSYSYNSGSEWLDYFQGTVSHNTIQFDDRDQMVRLGRFLFGGWLKNKLLTKIINNANGLFFEAGYSDSFGVSHCRSVLLSKSLMIITDTISGSFEKAVLRWRLMPGKWTQKDNLFNNGTVTLQISTDLQSVSTTTTDGWESRYYLKKTSLPVLEIEVKQPGKLVTKISWQ